MPERAIPTAVKQVIKAKRIFTIILAALCFLNINVTVFADGIYYLPDVTSEMSSPSFWADETDILMSFDEIEKLNKETVSAKGTNMYDLKNQPDVIDGISLNEALLKSSQADAAYYLGWTYLENTEKATQEDYDKIIENTQNPDAKKEQKVLYGIATKRTELRTFPAPVAIWDDPLDSDFDYQYLVSVRVNEPVVITSKSKDGNYYLAKSICCSGWIPKDAVAICDDKDEWISAWDIKNENVLVVWGDKVFTETSIVGAETSDLMLTMGTILELAISMFIINIRYFLMSLSVSQKVQPNISLRERLAISFGITDEVFAVFSGIPVKIKG